MKKPIHDRMRRAEEEVEYLLSELLHFRHPSSLRTEVGFRPSIDIYETEGAVVVLAEIAGVIPDSVEVSVGESSLTIGGVREGPLSPGERLSYHKMEICFGPFRRRVPLPCPVDPQGIEVSSVSGLLRMVLPKLEVRKPETRVIPIE